MDDEEIVVIIIGNEDADPLHIPIKDEPVDEPKESNLNAESILETGELYGEPLSTITKECEEEEYEYEYLEDIEESELQLEEATTENDNSKSSGDTVKNNIKPKKPKRNDSDDHKDAAPPENQLSYVAQLRKNFPKMRKDKNFLILHLVNVMKNTKLPGPPIDFCVPNGGRLACAYCRTESKNIPTACRHYQERHGPRVFVCLACGSNFRCTTGLYKHEKNCKAPDANLVLKARGRYLGRKAGHRPYPYRTNKKFQPDGVKPEKSVKKKHFCSLCTASFRQKEALQAHENMHRGIRPFHCDKCPMAYTSNLALRRHLLSHTDVEYICDTCKRSFKTRPTLLVHMNIHLPQPKYPCDKCERRFTQKIALKAHVDRDHLNIPPPFACVACPKRCQRITCLRSHMQIRHGLTLISRRMFFKALPSMKETEELKRATVVFNHSEYYVQKEMHNIDINNSTVDDKPTITVETDHEEAEQYNSKETFLETFDGKSTTEVHSERELSPVANDNEDAVDTMEVINSVDIQDDNNLYYEDGSIEDAENIIYTPKKPVVATSLPERSELEIKTSVAKSSVKRNKKSKQLKIDLSMVRANRNKNNINIPVLTDDLSKNDPDNDITNFIIFNENEHEIEIRVKDVHYLSGTKPINQRINVKKPQLNGTKTRSKVIVKNN